VGNPEQVNVERHYQQLCTSWRGELEAKQKEFDEAKAQILHPRCAGDPHGALLAYPLFVSGARRVVMPRAFIHSSGALFVAQGA
jgi:hypothetical protein